MTAMVRLALLLLAAASLQALTDAATSPVVSTSAGELSFSSADGKDIVFSPGIGGNLMLNGVQIKSAADLKGAQGTSGTKGNKGDVGNVGAVGNTGPQGPKGDQGNLGVTGSKGDNGVKGETGAIGPIGPKGETGTTGVAGVKGDSGATGPTGPKGEVGSQGVAGPKGDGGATGPTGPKGEMGPTGSNGQKGDSGAAGSAGPKGSTGAAGPKGDLGPAGPPGKVVTASSGCTKGIVPSCPFWLNVNTTRIAVTGSPIVRFATSGFTELYHPDFEDSYTCKFTGEYNSVESDYVAVKAVKDTLSGRIFYVVDCVVPNWTFGHANIDKYTETVNTSLWFQKKTEIPFAGKDGADQVTLYAGWHFARTDPSGAVTILGSGLNSTDYYACQFNNTTPAGTTLHLNSSAVLANSTTQFSCVPPHWNFTSDNRVTFNANVSVWRATASGVLLNKLAFFGTVALQDQYTYYRCRDGVTNGVETDVDCGGLCPNLCPSGKKCRSGADCATKVCSASGTCGLPGQDKLSPVDSCKALNWTSSGPAWVKWSSSVIQTYCNVDKSLNNGGWAMVWKHSYFQIDKSQLNNMKTFSAYSQPCLDLNVGWCNVPNKKPSGATEQMVAAYHNRILVYAYKGTLNSRLGQDNLGAYLNSASRVLDRCNNGVGTKPSISTHSSAVSGITFDKWSPDDYNSNCDTDWNNYKNDCRWENCNLPSSISSTSTHTQMTMAIYVR